MIALMLFLLFGSDDDPRMTHGRPTDESRVNIGADGWGVKLDD